MMHRWLGHDILDQPSGQKYLTPSEYLVPPPGPPPTYNHITNSSSKSNSYHGEPYIPADVFNELQNEVSSLLEFKNALLETFPHLHQKISGLGIPQIPQDGRRNLPPVGKPDPDISDDIPHSWNVPNPNTGSMPRVRRLRKSPEGSSTGSTVQDSGFSTEKDGNSGTSTLLSPATGGKMGPPIYPLPTVSPPDVRWDTWMMSSPSSPPPGAAGSHEDELMCLLDVIHRKAVKLRAQQIVEQDFEDSRRQVAREESRKFSDKSRPGLTLGAISENEGVSSDNEFRTSDEDKDRVRRKVITEEGINRHDRELLVDRISELETETMRSHTKVSKLESEISRISRQKELLEDQLRTAVNIKSELDNKIHDMHSQYVKGGNAGSAKKDPNGSTGPGGIIHSVQILTGGAHTNNSLHSSDYSYPRTRGDDRKVLSQSETNLRRIGDGSGSINIEIRQPGTDVLSKSSEHLLYGGRGLNRPSKVPMSPSVSVVNLRASSDQLNQGRSVDGLNALLRQRTNSFGTSSGVVLRPNKSLLHSENNSRFFQKISGPPNANKISPQLNRVLSNEKLSPKSRSFENLYDQRLAIKPSNSEISLQPRALYLDPPHSRLKSTQSEQVLTKIGRLEKVKLDAMSQSVLSMPAELARGFKIKPNRERIRQILGTNSVLELQRQLLTTVMENEVYKSQISRVTDGWNGKIDDFERINHGLQSSLSQLRDENELLRLQVEEKSIELEGTRARLRQLERTSDNPAAKKSSTSPGSSNKQIQTELSNSEHNGGVDLASRLGNDNYVKFGPVESRTPTEPRVTFDLGPKKAKIIEVPSAKVPVTVDMPAKRQPSQLPSDAKQRLQEMAGHDIKRNYRKSSSGDPPRPNRLNLNNGVAGKYAISPPSSPSKHQSPPIPSTPDNTNLKRTSLTRKDSRSSQLNNSAKNSLMNMQNNNISRQKTGRDSLPRQGTLGSNGHQRTRTPSVERSISSLKDGDARDPSKDASKLREIQSRAGETHGRILPAPPTLHLEHGLTSMELKHMGRDTIAGLIAGILQKYTKKEEALDTRGADIRKYERNPNNNSFVEIALADDENNGDDLKNQNPETEDTSRPVTALRRVSHNSTPVSTSRMTPVSRNSPLRITPLNQRKNNQRSTPVSQKSSTNGSHNMSQKSWEAYNHTEEMTQESHTAYNHESTESNTHESHTHYFDLAQDQNATEIVHNNYDSQDSLTLPDSLNEFEGEEYQSPNLYHDSLGGNQNRLTGLGSPQDIDSLQFTVSPTPVKDTNSPVDSLIAIKQSNTKINAAEFFDSITSLEKPKPNLSAQKRRIIPYCDNSLSSGTSAFTSQDVSFDSKDSSPSDTDRTRQGLPPPQNNNLMYPDVTLAIHPLREAPTPQNIPIHPLSKRYQTSLSPIKPSPTNKPSTPLSSSDLRIEDVTPYLTDEDPPQKELDKTQPELNANEVRSEMEVIANQTKENVANTQPQPLVPKTNMSLAKAATEKLKWKFLGW